MTLSSLSGLDYIGSATAGTDRILLRAYDGTWSNWAVATITDPGIAPPTVAATNQTVASNQSIPLTNVFSASGNGITQYQIWFSWAEGGFPALGTITNNGTAIALDQAVTLTSLSGLDYIGSATAGTDRILLRAYDGTWSNWAVATITDHWHRSARSGGDQSDSRRQPVYSADQRLFSERQWDHAIPDLVQLGRRLGVAGPRDDHRQRHGDRAGSVGDGDDA